MRYNRSGGKSAPMTLGQALAAKVRWSCGAKTCGYQSEPDVSTQVAQHGSTMTVPDWARLLRCSTCGAGDADFVVSGAAR